jgi:hypothetical protein
MSALLCYEFSLNRSLVILYGIYQILLGSIKPNPNKLALILTISTNNKYHTSSAQQILPGNILACSFFSSSSLQ